jgi:polysaccharide pyruvyl transferase WcaK-like protein
VILALSVGTPVHGIEYFTNKTRGVFAQFGLAEHWSEFDSFDGADALTRIKDLLSPENLDFLRSRAAEMRAGVRDIAMAQLVA